MTTNVFFIIKRITNKHFNLSSKYVKKYSKLPYNLCDTQPVCNIWKIYSFCSCFIEFFSTKEISNPVYKYEFRSRCYQLVRVLMIMSYGPGRACPENQLDYSNYVYTYCRLNTFWNAWIDWFVISMVIQGFWKRVVVEWGG